MADKQVEAMAPPAYNDAMKQPATNPGMVQPPYPTQQPPYPQQGFAAPYPQQPGQPERTGRGVGVSSQPRQSG